MKTRNLLIATAIALVAIAAVPFVYAQGMHHRARGAEGFGMMRGSDAGFGMMFGHLEHAREALGLTDQQVDQLKAIASDLHEKNAPYRDQLRGGFHSVAQTLLANPNDIAAAQTILDQQDAAHKAMRANILSAASKALGVLTPEQRTKISDFLAARAERARTR